MVGLPAIYPVGEPMTYLQLFDYLLKLKESGVDLESFDVTIEIENISEYYPISRLYEEEETDVVDAGTPILSV